MLEDFTRLFRHETTRLVQHTAEETTTLQTIH